MDPSPTGRNDVDRLVSIALLGLAGCGLTIVMTANPDQITPTRTVGAFAGLFLSFVAIAGVVDTFSGR